MIWRYTYCRIFNWNKIHDLAYSTSEHVLQTFRFIKTPDACWHSPVVASTNLACMSVLISTEVSRDRVDDLCCYEPWSPTTKCWSCLGMLSPMAIYYRMPPWDIESLLKKLMKKPMTCYWWGSMSSVPSMRDDECHRRTTMMRAMAGQQQGLAQDDDE